MNRTGADSWFIGSTIRETGQSSNLQQVSHSRLKSQPWAYVTLEAYSLIDNACDQYPTQPSKFFDMGVIGLRTALAHPKAPYLTCCVCFVCICVFDASSDHGVRPAGTDPLDLCSAVLHLRSARDREWHRR
jgi:hypothetical protein